MADYLGIRKFTVHLINAKFALIKCRVIINGINGRLMSNYKKAVDRKKCKTFRRNIQSVVMGQYTVEQSFFIIKKYFEIHSYLEVQRL